MDGYFHARAGYEAYAAYTGGLTFDGRKMPTWEELPDRVRDAWKAAALGIFAAAAPAIEARAMQATLPPLDDLDFDPDSKPTPIEVPHPQHEPKR